MLKPTLCLLLLLSSSAFARFPPQNAKEKFCAERLTNKHSVQALLSSMSHQLSFKNGGGLFDSGVCWWHSRFTRASAYLAIFDPSLPKPSIKEAKKIINHLRHRKGIVTVPGFRNLFEFSKAYTDEIMDKLEDWQKSDGLLKAAWVKGLKGEHTVDRADLKLIMDELYERVRNGEVVYQKLQQKGVSAHAWLVIGMRKLADGYYLSVLDSASLSSVDYFMYIDGMTSLINHIMSDKPRFVPYTEEVNEEVRLRELLTQECSGII